MSQPRKIHKHEKSNFSTNRFVAAGHLEPKQFQQFVRNQIRIPIPIKAELRHMELRDSNLQLRRRFTGLLLP
jgi:hypothetical protein